MLQEYAAWWLAQMRALLGQSAGRDRLPDAVLLRVTPDGTVQAGVRRGGRVGPASRLRADTAGRAAVAGLQRQGPVVLTLPDDSLLQHDTTLPLAAERDPATVLRYEMDRLTPFSAAEIAWTWRVLRRDVANQRLLVRLSMVPRAAIAPAVAACAAAGLVPARVEAAGVSIDLAAPGVPRGRGLTRALAAACVLLAVLACAVPVLQQQRAMDQAQATIEALRPRVAAVEALRARLAARAGAGQLLQAEEARGGNALAALVAVTRALPDDTYLTSLAMKDRQVTVTGRSAAAVRLIGALSADPALRNPAFAAPVMRLGGDTLDQFALHADLANPAPPAAPPAARADAP